MGAHSLIFQVDSDRDSHNDPPYVTCLSRCPRPDFGCSEAPQGCDF